MAQAIFTGGSAMRRLTAGALLLLLGSPALAQGDADRLVRECDRLGGFVWFRDRGGAGPLYVDMKPKEALSACLAAAKAAPEDARTLYNFGRALRKNERYAEARTAFQLADSLGNGGRSTLELGVMHELGLGGGRDLAEARRLYERAIAGGFNHAKFQLGWLYERGQGVPNDKAKAGELYEDGITTAMKNARQSRPYAEFLVGWLYHWGEPVRDYAKAKNWFQKAAKGGQPLAMRNLGMIHAEGGFGVKRDLAAAERWYELAVQAGDKDSVGYLEQLKKQPR
jgi:TPR repeat protein